MGPTYPLAGDRNLPDQTCVLDPETDTTTQGDTMTSTTTIQTARRTATRATTALALLGAGLAAGAGVAASPALTGAADAAAASRTTITFTVDDCRGCKVGLHQGLKDGHEVIEWHSRTKKVRHGEVSFWRSLAGGRAFLLHLGTVADAADAPHHVDDQERRQHHDERGQEEAQQAGRHLVLGQSLAQRRRRGGRRGGRQGDKQGMHGKDLLWGWMAAPRGLAAELR